MKKEMTIPKEKPHITRKKLKRVQESLEANKEKNSKKSKVIKDFQDRTYDLKYSRDNWRNKYYEKEIENKELNEKLNLIASEFEMTKEHLQQLLDDFNKKKRNNRFKTH